MEVMLPQEILQCVLKRSALQKYKNKTKQNIECIPFPNERQKPIIVTLLTCNIEYLNLSSK